MKRLTNIERIIRDFLIYCARRESTITYGELGDNVGRTARGPWTADLCAVRDHEVVCDRPDLTLVVVSRRTGFPTRYMDRKFDTTDERLAACYRKDLDRLFRFWRKRDHERASRPEHDPQDKRPEIANDSELSLTTAAFSRQEREDQDFIDAITDWDWGDR